MLGVAPGSCVVGTLLWVPCTSMTLPCSHAGRLQHECGCSTGAMYALLQQSFQPYIIWLECVWCRPMCDRASLQGPAVEQGPAQLRTFICTRHLGSTVISCKHAVFLLGRGELQTAYCSRNSSCVGDAWEEALGLCARNLLWRSVQGHTL